MKERKGPVKLNREVWTHFEVEGTEYAFVGKRNPCLAYLGFNAPIDGEEKGIEEALLALMRGWA